MFERAGDAGLLGVALDGGAFSCGEHLLQLIDVVDDGVGAFLLEQEDQVDVARVGGRGDADERHAGGARAAGVVHGVADVADLAAGVACEDVQQALGVRACGCSTSSMPMIGIEDQVAARSGASVSCGFRAAAGR